MHDEVGAECERLLEVRGCEGVVDGENRPGCVRCLCSSADVDDVEERVRRRLDPDESNVVVQIRRQVVVELVGRDVRELVALRLVDLRRHPVDAAVDVRDQDDALARVDEVHDRRRRTEPGRVREPELGALETRERRLERAARRVRYA
jgi:hypothetical protein